MREKTMRKLAGNLRRELNGKSGFIKKMNRAKRIALFACVIIGALAVCLTVWISVT